MSSLSAKIHYQICNGNTLVFPGRGGKVLLRVRFVRTLRVPDDDRYYPLPAGLGLLPIRSCREASGNVSTEWRDVGAVMIPLHPREAFWLAFEGTLGHPCAVKVGTGGVNAISGHAWSPTLADLKYLNVQDYVVCPPQRWIDGYNTGHGTIRQFVAVEHGRQSTVEWQLTGKETTGGVQIIVYEDKHRRYAGPRMEDIFNFFESGKLRRHDAAEPDTLGVGAGGHVSQKIYPDPHGPWH